MISTVGHEVINIELKALADPQSQRGSKELQRLGELRDRLSLCMAQLTDGMQTELVLSMLLGISMEVITFLKMIAMFQEPVTPPDVVSVVLFWATMGMTLVCPCEAGQRMLQLTAESRRLLLQLEGLRPELASQAALLREAAVQDLDTLGDLGLFRLRRSTIVSVSSTILTYVIIMVQFAATETDSD
ncbi:hypothetical protein FJT64_015393 [Amphibalanus amphitrite]|uniref:Uncharacterized protein n=1 Tax=Amphibalanus amphitrite TaxID=1232801 RepID=A0A6A4XGX8_AMPAM|nr:hypothetical protein FJT64_015393 [Amphibalanus amphitrite]